MTTQAWQEELEIAIRAAITAGELLRGGFTKTQTVLADDGHDIKLQADRDAEALILKALRLSSYPVVAEESGEHGDLRAGGPFWVVDPLDGTANFSRGVPQCCVSIALSRPDDPILGVILDFNRNDLFTGIVDAGAWHNGRPMAVSAVTHAAQGILSTGFPADFDFDDAGMRQMAEQLRKFKKVRMIGSAALALAYVACGRFDAYFEINTRFWDIAAGAALVKAAGGDIEITSTGKGTWARHVRGAANRSIWQ